jgi:hypothetical protein
MLFVLILTSHSRLIIFHISMSALLRKKEMWPLALL